MTSLRKRLFVLLAAATGAVWLFAGAATFFWTRGEIERVLDTRLQEAARMVASLGAGSQIRPSDQTAPIPLPAEAASYQRQLACQLWSFDGRLVGRSSGAPDERRSDGGAGFSEKWINGEPWRVFTVEDANKGIRVLVGDRLGLRERLVAHLIAGLVLPALLILPLLAVLIWSSLGRGLLPLLALADKLRQRDAEDLSLVEAGAAPAEIRPLVDALNNLFSRLARAMKHERDITAFAAHEMKTPLAGLKTHAQVALAAKDPTLREASLKQILIAVDRTTRLVRQMLDLARMDAGLERPPVSEINIGSLLRELTESSRPPQATCAVSIDARLNDLVIHANREHALLALRNLHENAVAFTPADRSVRWSATADGTGAAIEDGGPGIPDEELPLVTQRFFRGRNKSAAGSGLGLAIVDLALRRMGATMKLRNKPQGEGLVAEIRWSDPAHH